MQRLEDNSGFGSSSEVLPTSFEVGSLHGSGVDWTF